MRTSARSARPAGACAAVGCSLTLTFAPLAAAEEQCWTGLNGQFFHAIQYCVSSVLAPQGANAYGPQNLARWDGDASKAWCKGAPGDGIGETIRIRIEGADGFRRLLFENGYGKSPDAYEDNARVKSAEITAGGGVKIVVTLADAAGFQHIELPSLARDWLQFKIVEVYRGKRFADMCVSLLVPDFEYEEELLLKQENLKQGPQ